MDMGWTLTGLSSARTCRAWDDWLVGVPRPRVVDMPYQSEIGQYSAMTARAQRWHVPMSGRDPAEEHRAATPLELFFDLCFVVAVAQASVALHHEVAAGHLLEGALFFLMTFFAIWWAWMNFTWFASAYDTDDVLYRLLTFVQIAGVLVIAAGVARTFEGLDYVTITVGYLIMRIGLVAQWLRVAVEHPDRRRTALRFALGVTLVQIGWVSRLFL